MCTLRRSSVLIAIMGMLSALLSGCGAGKGVVSYEERRQIPLSGELPMEEMEFCGVEAGSEEPVCFSYLGEGIQVSLCAGDGYEPAKICIQGEVYDFSFAGYSPQGTEPPEVCLADVNGDGVLDVLLRGEAYRGCITCGKTVEKAVANAADAKRAWIETALEEGIEINEPVEEHSKREGTGMNQYCMYFLSRNDAVYSK